MLSPSLAAAPPAHDFRVVRTDGSSRLVVFLSNPTEVDAVWTLRHVPRGARASDGIDGDNARPDSLDDPSVFEFSEETGSVRGPSLPLRTAAACVPKDFNRTNDALFTQTVTALTWRDAGGAAAVTTLDAALAKEAAANPRAPRPVGVTFKPKTNRRYCSRFRFCVEEGEGFDVVFQGAGSFEENVLARSVRIAGGR